MLDANVSYPSTPQSADVPSLEEKVRKMIDEDLVVSTLDALLVDKRGFVFTFSSYFRSVPVLDILSF